MAHLLTLPVKPSNNSSMPVFRLTEDILFPRSELAEDNGLLAVGGDLSTKRLIAAYRQGIIPWYAPGDPLLWWFTSPRLVLFPAELHVSKRLARYLKNSDFTTTADRAFTQVIRMCADVRTDSRKETWISKEMQQAYIQLHQLGHAHSVECWQDGILAGGLYGVALDKVFFGESMFSRVSNSSKAAFIHLVAHLRKKDFQLIDCQMTTRNLLHIVAREVTWRQFTDLLQK
ncbi:MAG: leucyl/phenylalanyl-tRNA--protein transferase, partial [Desulfoprunum sp.]|nr:leucyl/phenylalanyl-tRNA--protein transferase [Desulfoprunum sp.]